MHTLPPSTLRPRFALVLAFAGLLPAAAPGAAIVSPIDDFKDIGQAPQESPSSAGLERAVEFDMTSNPGNQNGSVIINPIGNGYLVISLGPGVEGTTRLNYSATNGPVDLTARDANALSFGISFSDLSTRFSATVHDSNGNIATADYQSTLPVSSDTEFLLPYSTFTNRQSTNFSLVSRIVLEFEPSGPGADLVVDRVATAAMPEPSSAILTLLAGSWLLLRRRR